MLWRVAHSTTLAEAGQIREEVVRRARPLYLDGFVDKNGKTVYKLAEFNVMPAGNLTHFSIATPYAEILPFLEYMLLHDLPVYEPDKLPVMNHRTRDTGARRACADGLQ